MLSVADKSQIMEIRMSQRKYCGVGQFTRNTTDLIEPLL